MKRRGVADGKLPDELVHYRETDWVGPNELDPYPLGEADPPAVRWSRARRSWSRHARSLAELNALYPGDLVMPPTVDPRAEREVAVSLTPGLRHARRPVGGDRP